MPKNIPNYNLKTKKYPFNSNTPSLIENDGFYLDWPVVYVLNNNKNIYIGETYHSADRMRQHLKSDEKKVLDTCELFASDRFTKSATLDIESSLIELCSSDSLAKNKILNKSNGITRHNYADKQYFSQESYIFNSIWNYLKNRKIVSDDILQIKNTDLFKYTPYKSLNAEQCTYRDYIIKTITDYYLNDEVKHKNIFVNGSSGTGKTILAIYLLKLLVSDSKDFELDFDIEDSELSGYIKDLLSLKEKKKKLEVAYVVSMVPFRGTLKEVFKNIKGLKSNMVIAPAEVSKKKYDVLIVDEAHRLKQPKSLGADVGSFYNTNLKLGFVKDKGTQLEWILKQSDISILFYDSNQTVKPCDIDYSEFNKLVSNSDQYNLTSQMRCLGSNDYIKYIHSMLDGKCNKYMDFSDNYDFKLFISIDDFCNRLLDKENIDGLCRIVSGYGFEWINKKQKVNKKRSILKKVSTDISIENRKFYWNLRLSKWPISLEGNDIVDEVGCIHTIQGYDLNYCGVIFGPEIIYRNNHIEIDKDKYYDINGKQGVNDLKLKEYIINIYYVLLSRGIKGTYVYVCDDQLREYLSKFITTV